MNISSTVVNSGSTLTGQVGAGGTLTVSTTTLSGGSQIIKRTASTAGALTVNTGSRFNSSGFVFHDGTGNVILSAVQMSESSRVFVQSGDRNFTLNRVTGTELAQFNLSGTGAAVTDNILDTNVSSRAVVTFSSTGAAGNNLFYSSQATTVCSQS
jgi:hypothetical protein